MTTPTVEQPQTLRCQKCPTVFFGSRPDLNMSVGAQARTFGWIVWSGTTIGGRAETRQFCPRCAGNVPPPETDGPSWDAVCDTCDASAGEEWEDEGPLSEDDVASWKSDHQCEPSVRVIRPQAAKS